MTLNNGYYYVVKIIITIENNLQKQPTYLATKAKF